MAGNLHKPHEKGHLRSGGKIPETTPDGRRRAVTKSVKALKFKRTKVEIKDPWGRKIGGE